MNVVVIRCSSQKALVKLMRPLLLPFLYACENLSLRAELELTQKYLDELLAEVSKYLLQRLYDK